MALTIDQIKLYLPYKLSRIVSEDDNSFLLFMDKKENPLVLEHNSNISSVSIHRWRTSLYEKYHFEVYKDLRYVIKTLFEAQHFIVDKR